jgi:hypothetical protein
MSGAEDEIRGADAIQVYKAASPARRVQGEAEPDSGRTAKKDWQAPAPGYIYIPSVVVKCFFVFSGRIYQIIWFYNLCFVPECEHLRFLTPDQNVCSIYCLPAGCHRRFHVSEPEHSTMEFDQYYRLCWKLQAILLMKNLVRYETGDG